MRIRAALSDDARAVQALVQAGFESYRAFAPPGWEPPDQLGPERLELARREIADPAVLCLVAEDDGELVGTVRLVPLPDGPVDHHLRHLFVVERCWGGGLARELHAAAVATISGTARLMTPAGQARARCFYEREGWTLHGGVVYEPRMGLDLVEYRRRCPRPPVTVPD